MKRELNVDHLTRVEGHGAVDIVLENDRLKEIKLRFTEGPRFFEFITRERRFNEIPKIVSRICGICYVSHRLASVTAVEDAFRASPTEEAALLRKLLIVGEYLESHALHLYFLALPDYLGYPSAVAMAKEYPNVVKRGFRIKEVGNKIMKLIGGKTVHGENILPGGFASVPTKEQLEEVSRWLNELLNDLEATLYLFDSLDYFELESPVELEMTLSDPIPTEMVSNLSLSDGTCFTKFEFEHFVQEEPSPYSTAKRSTVSGKPFRIGPLARVNRALDSFSDPVKDALKRLKISFPSRNPLHANLARAVEMLELAYRGMQLVEELLKRYPLKGSFELSVKEGTGFGVKEAPRGTLYHRYHFDSEGYCKGANIITPTAQLQACIEEDLKALVDAYSYLPDGELKKRAEMLIRAYDP
jgi:sulfhydrogenase subunit alpha